jgi:HK97 family phage major capsid protein
MRKYINGPSGFKLAAALSLCALAMFGMVDASAAMIGAFIIGDVEPASIKELNAAVQKALGVMGDAVKRNQDNTEKALEDIKRGDAVNAKTADDLKKYHEESKAAADLVKDLCNKIGDRVKDVEQKIDKRHQRDEEAERDTKSAGQLFAESDVYKDMIKSRGFNSLPFPVSRKAAVVNATTNNDQPLVRADRVPGIIGPGLRRFTIRDLVPNLRTTSNLIEYASELLFTSGAVPQGGTASPTSFNQGEGELKGEASLTFQLANSPVITIAHYIPASRQVLSDAVALEGYINSRLTYGLKLEEEDEILNGTGTNGKLNGLRNQAAAFTGGATNASRIDTMLRAFTQVSLSYFDASGLVLHPLDWQDVPADEGHARPLPVR